MRDKLIELIGKAIFEEGVYSSDGKLIEKYPVRAVAIELVQPLADYLIAHGVIMQRWIPVSERLPEHGAKVLCATMFDMRVMHWNESAELWVDEGAAHTKRFVERWVPIPEDPKEDE